MTFTEAAAEVLRIAGKPLHYKEITELAIEKNLLSHVGKSPEVTMGARLAALLKKEDKENPIVRVKPGVFALREWDGKKKKRGANEEAELDESAGVEVNALELEESQRRNRAADDDDEPILVSGEDALRADLAASGAEMFDDEDDDDQPILAGPSAGETARSTATADARGGSGGGNAGGPPSEDGQRRRRRRRRRRGGREGGTEERTSSPRLDVISPTAIVSVETDSSIDTSRDPLAPAPRPMIRDRQQIMAGGAPTGIDIPPGEQDELAGRELADATIMILSGFDRTQGPVQLRSVVDALLRRGRLSGDTQLAGALLNAALRADNLRRQASGQRPRFRFSQSQGGARVALTDWSLPADLVRLELDAIAAIERYREASRRNMLRKLQELPGHALIELVLLGLERVGMTNLRTVRRAGAPGGEAHFAATHRNGSDEVRTAVVIRKDGREVGRERVSDLRGALHHYGPAAAGWLITTGQVLSGAREESGAPAAPIALFDGVAICRLLEENDVGVVRTRYTTAIPDLELYETLRGYPMRALPYAIAAWTALAPLSGFAAPTKAAKLPEVPALPAPSVTLKVTPGPTMWALRIENTGDTPVRIPADPRLLVLELVPVPAAAEVDPPKKGVVPRRPAKVAGPPRCALPDDTRPTTDEGHDLVLPSKRSWSTTFDPTFDRFGARERAALAAGTTVKAHFGWRPAAKGSAPPFAVTPVGASVGKLGPLKEIESDAFTLADAAIPRDARPPNEADPSGVTLSVPETMDAARGVELATTVSLKNETDRPIALLFRPDMIEFTVKGPAGTVTCGMPRTIGSPIRELFVTVPVKGTTSVGVLFSTTCATETFDEPGLYRVTPKLDTTSASGRALGIKSWDGVAVGKSPLLLRVRQPRKTAPLARPTLD